MGEKELIWVPKELKEAWERVESQEEKEKIFFKAIENRKIDVKCQIENLEDDVLLFKGIGIRYKNELEKIYNEQSEHLEKIWKDFNAGDKIYKQAKQISNSLQPIISTVNSINNSFKDFSTYKIERLIEVIEKFNRMSDEDKKMLKILIDYSNK